MSWLAVGLFGFLLGIFLWTRLTRWLDRRDRQTRSTRAIRGEERAEEILEDAGFTILARQSRMPWPVLLGDDEHLFELRADFIVQEAGVRYVAEVKTGDVTSIEHAGTRRQLLEYLLAYDVTGVLLVDVEEGLIEEVSFPLLAAPRDQIAETAVPRAHRAMADLDDIEG